MIGQRLLFYLLFAAALFPAAAGEETGLSETSSPGGWMENVNPADYALLAADLKDPFRFEGEINAQASSTGYAITTSKGLERQNVSFLELIQEVGIKGMREDCSGFLSLYVAVFETPEQAVAFCQEHFQDFGFTADFQGFTPGYNGLGDPRLEGKGASSTRGHIVQYQNMVARISDLGCISEIPEGTVASFARLWLDKVSRIKSPERPDLHLDPDRIYLSYHQDNNLLPTEISADSQAVAVEVENAGAVEARDVRLQLYLKKGEELQPVGRPAYVGDIPAGSTKSGTAFWDLEGKNIEGAVLQAQAFMLNGKDADEEDNNASITVNIYYAHNGNRAYSWIDDTYSFDNYGFDGRETEEMVEGLLATAVGNMQADADFLSAMQRLLFPSTFMKFWNYSAKSMEMGAGGHCYGMSATSGLYFMDPEARPLSKPASQMSLEEASTNIAIYHRAQMLPLWTAMMSDFRFFQRDQSPAKCHQAVKDALKDSRLPVIIEFFGRIDNSSAGHAVLAYKLIEVQGREPVVYVYDPNFPVSKARPPRPMPQITLTLSNSNWKNPSYMGYMWAYAGAISAHPVYRQIPLQEVNALVPSLKKSLYEMAGFLKKANAVMAVLRCPADAVFVDEQGRRTGVADGRTVNEIPGAEVLTEGEVEIYLLPAEGRYSLSIASTGQGSVDLDVIRPEDGSAGITSFQDMTVQTGVEITGTIQAGGEISTLQSGSQSIPPTLEASVDLSGFGGEAQGQDQAGDSSSGEEVQAQEELILEVNTLGGVANGPTSPVQFTLDRARLITRIRTYHWNYGSGQTLGTISIEDASGNLYGPWTATGEPGMGAVPDAYWTVQPDLELPAGVYTIVDSDPETWSQNSETGGRGVSWIWGQSVQENEVPEEQILKVDTLGAVSNYPFTPTTFSLDRPATITKIQTYHWNYGSGQTPGTISIEDASGNLYGPWTATGEPGMGGVPDAYWIVLPRVQLSPGVYTIVDSDPETWSQNDETGGRGIAHVWGIPSQSAVGTAGSSDWSGTWNTDWGPMQLQQSGNRVNGTYTHDQGRIDGTAYGNRLVGTWSEAPSYSPPGDAGDMEFMMSEDGQSFSGSWRYGSDGGWSGGWTGSRQ
ncbi:MAG: hypothetical protein HPY61_03975 [Methanotrichaceae archaeon]|nr:hypothetical protein [Methanotrichaceae archaeon]